MTISNVFAILKSASQAVNVSEAILWSIFRSLNLRSQLPPISVLNFSDWCIQNRA